MGNELKRTKLGEWLFNSVNKVSLYIAYHKVLFYILSYTWGLITTLFGWIVYLFLRIFFKNKIQLKGKFFTARYIMLFDEWGGLELGTNFILAGNMGKYFTEHTKCHELGHTYQNAALGPFAIIFIFIPSVIQYWIQRLRKDQSKNKPYDLIWFEGSATYIGETLLSNLEHKDYHYYNEQYQFNNNYGANI